MRDSPGTKKAARGGEESDTPDSVAAACGNSSGRSSPPCHLPDGGDSGSKSSHSSSIRAATSVRRTSSNSATDTAFGEEPSSICDACPRSVGHRQARACPLVVEELPGAVAVTGPHEAAATAYRSREDGCVHQVAAPAVAVPSTSSAAPAGPHPSAAAVRLGADACPAAVPAAAASRDATAAVASSLDPGAQRRFAELQLQSLSEFSRSVGISEFVLCDDCTTNAPVAGAAEAAAAEAAAAEAAETTAAGRVAVTDVVAAARRPATHALKGSLKTLFEDFQVYEHSYFPCECRAQKRSCLLCGSDGSGSASSCSTRSDSSGSSSSSCSEKLDLSSCVGLYSSESRILEANSSTRENNRGSNEARWKAAAGKGLHACPFGCWCTAFGGDKPLRLPYLVLPCDVLRQKQEQLLRESGATRVSPSFCLKYCDASFATEQVDSTRSRSSGSSRGVAPGEESSVGSVSSSRNRRETVNSGEAIKEGSGDACSASERTDVHVSGRTGSSSSVDNVREGCCCKSVEDEVTCDDDTRSRNTGRRQLRKEGKAPCCTAAGTAEAAAAPAREATATEEVGESSPGACCPFSALEAQNVEAFVRYLAVSSALYRAQLFPTQKLQPQQMNSQEKVVQQQQQRKGEGTQHAIGEQRGGGPGLQEPSGQCALLRRRNSVYDGAAAGARECERSAALPRNGTRLLVEATQTQVKEDWGHGCVSCCCATATADAALRFRWEAAAAQAAAEAEEAAVAAALDLAAEKSCRSGRVSSSVGREASGSVRSRKTASENPFFEPDELADGECGADSPVPQTQGDEQLAGQQQGQQQRSASEAEGTQSQQRRTAELCPVTQERQERQKNKNAERAGRQKRRQRKTHNKESDVPRPTLWLLGDWTSFICRQMLEVDLAAAPDSSVDAFAEANDADAGRRASLPSPAVDAFRAASFEAGSAVECGGAVGDHDSPVAAAAAAANVAASAAAAPVAGGCSASVCLEDKFAAAVAACVDKSAPSLKELQKGTRRHMHQYIHDVLPFLVADTLPVGELLRDEECEGQQPRNEEQKDMRGTHLKRPRRGEEQQEAEQDWRTGQQTPAKLQPHKKEQADTQRDDEEAQGDQQRKPQGGVQRNENEIRWGLLRTYVPPGALQSVSAQPVPGAAAELTAAAPAEEDRSLLDSFSAERNKAEGRTRAVSPHAEASAGGETAAVTDQGGKSEQQQYLKYFVSIAACVAQQCRALQQLLTLLQQQRQRLHRCLSEREVVASKGQGHQQQDCDHEMQWGEEQCWQKQRLWTRLAHCEEWVNLVTAARTALVDEEEQRQLLLMRLTPTPTCMRYLFPRRKDLLDEQKHVPVPVRSRDSSGRVASAGGSAAADNFAAAGSRASAPGACDSVLSTRGFTGANRGKSFARCLPRLPQQASASAPFLHFVLLKINRDTAASLRLLEEQLRQQRMLRNSSSSWTAEEGRNGGRLPVNTSSVIAAAGTKDKRGVTVQRCSASKVSAEALLEACYLGRQQRQHSEMQQEQQDQLQQHRQQAQHPQERQLQQPAADVHAETRPLLDASEDEQLPSVYVAPLGYYTEPQWLGGLRGNFFQVIIRNLRPATDGQCCHGGPVRAARHEAVQSPTAGKHEVFGGSSAAAGAAATTRVASIENTQGIRGMKSPVEGAVGGRLESAQARPAAAKTVGAEEPVTTLVATSSSLPSTDVRSSAQAADPSEDLRNAARESSAEAEKQGVRARPRSGGVHCTDLFVPLSDCEDGVQQLGRAVGSSMSSFCSQGFLNYYGLQRFGTHAVRTYEVGAALLREDWTAAVAGILGGKTAVRLGAAASHKAATCVRTPTNTGAAAAAASAELAAVCKGEAAGVAERSNESDCVVIEKLSASIVTNKQRRARVTTSSPWELLQQEGPAAALKSLARHQHIERSVLSALLRHHPPQGQARHVQSALNRRRESPCSLTCSSSVGSALPSAAVSCVASAGAPLHERRLSSGGSPLDDHSSSPGARYAAKELSVTQQGSFRKPRHKPGDSAAAPTTTESYAEGRNGTKFHPRQQRLVEGDQGLQLRARGGNGQEQRQPGSVVEGVPCYCQESSSPKVGAASAVRSKSPAERDCEKVPQSRRSTGREEKIPSSTAFSKTAATAAVADRAAAAAAHMSAGTLQASNLPKPTHVVKKFSVSPAVSFRALREVTPTSLQLYLHAAQSVLFNFACSWRWRTYGPRVRVGDFVCGRDAPGNSLPQLSSRAVPSCKHEKLLDGTEAVRAHNSGPREADAGIYTVEVGADGPQANCRSAVVKENVAREHGKAGELSGAGTNAQSLCHLRPRQDVSAAAAHICDSSTREEVSDVLGGHGGKEGKLFGSRQAGSTHVHDDGQRVRRIHTEEEALNASIDDVMLPLAGTDVEYPADLLQVYRQLSREILGVEFEAFRKFNAGAAERGCVSRERRRHESRKKGSHPASGRENNLAAQRIIGKRGKISESSITRETRSTNSSSSNSLGRGNGNGTNNPGSSIEVGPGDIEEVQQAERDGVVDTSKVCCEAEGDIDSQRLGVDALSSSAAVEGGLSAEDGEKLDVKDLGISCKGGFRPLLVRPRCCSWQLLRVGHDPDAEPKPLLLSDVDLLLRRRRLAAQREAYEDGMFLKGDTVQHHVVPPHQPQPRHLHVEQLQKQQTYEAAQGDFRVSWDEELSSGVVRCIPREQQGTDQFDNGVKVPQYSSASGRQTESVRLGSMPVTFCDQEERSRTVEIISDGGPQKKSSCLKEARKHEDLHEEQMRETWRTKLIVRGERSNFCLLLRFWLPAGCYFTMALREIMKANAPDEDGAAFAGARLQNATAD